jgi:hypothetical protein
LKQGNANASKHRDYDQQKCCDLSVFLTICDYKTAGYIGAFDFAGVGFGNTFKSGSKVAIY